VGRGLAGDERPLPALAAPPAVGGFRGLAAFAATLDGRFPEAAEADAAPAPLRPSFRLEAPVRAVEGPSGEALPARRSDGPFGPWGPEDSAAPGGGLGAGHGPIGADLEAALDHALRRAARRHGIEVLEP
jgi:hypothetical protein